MYQPQFKLSHRLNSFLQQFDQLGKKITSLNENKKKEVQEKTFFKSLYLATKLKGINIKEETIRSVVVGKNPIFSNSYLEGYYRAFQFCHQCEDLSSAFSPLMIQKIHQLLSNSAIYNYNNLRLRRKNISLVGINGVVYPSPSYLRLPVLVDQFFEFLNSSVKSPPLILGGISYFILLVLHPYEAYGEEVSRLFTYFLFSCRESRIKNFFSLERGFFQSQPEYYAALKQTLDDKKELSDYDLTPWLEFFSSVVINDLLLSLSFEVKRKQSLLGTRKLSQLRKHPKGGYPGLLKTNKGQENKDNSFSRNLKLTPRQLVLLNFLRTHSTLVMAQARQLFSNLSDDTLLRELQGLQKRGLIEKRGRTKGTYYTLK